MRTLIIVAVFLVSCNSKHDKPVHVSDADYFKTIAKNDIDLGEPLTGDWRATYHEKQQTFEQYIKSNPKKAILNKTTLYLQPLGYFTTEQHLMLERVKAYLAAFFQLSTIILDPIPDSRVPESDKRTRDNGKIQLYTPYILDTLLKGNIPGEGYALMAISEKDLYPDPSWNFVFGTASYADRVGVTSIARLETGLNSKQGYDSTFLQRVCKIAAHEIGHMFSIHHCVVADCTMNGSNNLWETDQQTSRLCSACQQKLHWNIKYNNLKRLNDLAAFYLKYGLTQDYLSIKADLDEFR
jgi:archaemetzincin